MLHKTRGIVLKTTSYSESSVVVQVFTEKFGLQSYLINGVKKPKAKIRINILQPLHLLDMIVYHKGNEGIQRVSELRQFPLFQSIPYDIVKSSIAMFLNEVLYKSLKQHEPDETMFGFLFKAIEVLDQSDSGIANFHLHVLLRLTRFLGFYPDTTQSAGMNYFDLKNGTYERYQPPHLLFLEQPYTRIWTALLDAGFGNLAEVQISNADRRHILEKLISFYQLHIEGFGLVKSHEVLEEVLGAGL